MATRLAIAIAVLVGPALNGAHAQYDSWCVYFTGKSPNCAFATFQECIKTIQGKTGICNRNAGLGVAADGELEFASVGACREIAKLLDDTQ